jgi:molybdopterin-guanine dinucleotide biosynthesis protein A
MITTVILAGGQGSRIGGGKGLQRLQGKPLIQWVIDAMQPQSDELVISANGEGYAGFGFRVVADITAGSAGPLAGVQAALHSARHDLVASVPCDAPYLPADLTSKLAAAMNGADACVAVAAGRAQPAIALYRKSVLGSLDHYLADGGRKAMDWQKTLQLNEAAFEDAQAFININTRAELENLNERHA